MGRFANDPFTFYVQLHMISIQQKINRLKSKEIQYWGCNVKYYSLCKFLPKSWRKKICSALKEVKVAWLIFIFSGSILVYCKICYFLKILWPCKKFWKVAMKGFIWIFSVSPSNLRNHNENPTKLNLLTAFCQIF